VPWNQLFGSERDYLDEQSLHLMSRDRLVRLYQYAASAILDGLEEQVRAQSGKQIVLNARDKTVQFYCRHA
jgi:hypothetical protein